MNKRLLCEVPHRYYGEGTVIKIYDIQEPESFGALYPDNAWQRVPRAWFPQAALAALPTQKIPRRRVV